MADIVIIDYGAGNLHSVKAGFTRIMDATDTLIVSDAPDALASASHIVLPGVGAYGDCIAALNACTGMIDALNYYVQDRHVPFLGICVGMQMLMERGMEHGTHEGLGWFAGDVVAIEPNDPALKIPHMGWNELTITRPHPATHAINNGDHAYFVHSYMAQCSNSQDILATTHHGATIPAIIGRGHILGMQCHPEKSQQVGTQMLVNFLNLG